MERVHINLLDESGLEMWYHYLTHNAWGLNPAKYNVYHFHYIFFFSKEVLCFILIKEINMNTDEQSQKHDTKFDECHSSKKVMQTDFMR